jgi:hypothetical protein
VHSTSAITAKEPTQAPPPHTSPLVHASPSSQDAVLSVTTHSPAPSQAASVQTLSSSAPQAVPAAAGVQASVQQPSVPGTATSQPSPASTVPLPHSESAMTPPTPSVLSVP